MLEYPYKSEPYAHQRHVFEHSRDLPAYGLLMGMGTGKSKVTIDTAAWLYMRKEIRCLLVVAPKDVHRAWISEQLPAHMPEACNHRAATWYSDMKRAQRDACDALFDEAWPGLAVVAMNVEAFRDATKCKAALFARRLMKAYPTLLAVDEASWIKTPSAKRTKSLIALGRLAKYRRILTGTPVTNAPLDVYAPFNFLDPDILGFPNWFSFKHYFAVWESQHNYATGNKYETLKGYRNLEELQAKVAAYSYRITKEECLDLPAKIYQTRYVALTEHQRRIYNELVDRGLLELDPEAGPEFIPHVLTRLLRLQQVVGGFLPKEGGVALPIEGGNPRMQVVLDIAEELDGKAIVWARFRAEIDMLAKLLREKYGNASVVEYHGGVGSQEREAAVNAFQHGDARFFVGQQHSGGYGLTLHAATTVIYYSNDFSLEARLQSEDRAHRIGQHHPVNYVDIECLGTIDTRILEALRSKKDLAELITRDNVRQLLARAKG